MTVQGEQGSTSDSADSLFTKLQTTCQDKLNKPLSPTSDSTDYLFTKLQYYITEQGK